MAQSLRLTRFPRLPGFSAGKRHAHFCAARRKGRRVPPWLETQPMADPKTPHQLLPKPTRLLTPSEAAGYLSISPRTLTRLTAMGDLPHAQIGGQRRYELEALLAYVARQRRGG
jgi:excisionase family DNA binding protein